MVSDLFPIQVINDCDVVDSRLIAMELGIQHESFVKTIKGHQTRLEKRGVLRFEIAKPVKGSSGGRPETFYWLNERHCNFLTTLSRNTEQVVELKDKIEESFYQAKQALKKVKANEEKTADKNTTETVLNSALQLLSDVSSKLENSQSLVIQTSFEKISILEEENIRLELANQVNDEVTLKHKIYKSLYILNAIILAEDYHFPDIDYTVGEILKMFSVTSMTETRFANLCSALYWLDYNKKPNESGVFRYKGKDLIYPSLLLFKQENYEWFDIKEQFELSYKNKFPTSNRRYVNYPTLT